MRDRPRVARRSGGLKHPRPEHHSQWEQSSVLGASVEAQQSTRAASRWWPVRTRLAAERRSARHQRIDPPPILPRARHDGELLCQHGSVSSASDDGLSSSESRPGRSPARCRRVWMSLRAGWGYSGRVSRRGRAACAATRQPQAANARGHRGSRADQRLFDGRTAAIYCCRRTFVATIDGCHVKVTKRANSHGMRDLQRGRK